MNATQTINEDSWTKVISDFRQVCLLRREGKVPEANRILDSELPRSISRWAHANSQDAATKRRDLETMFREEQRCVDNAWMVQHLVVSRLSEQLLPTLCAKVADEVREVVAAQFDRNRETPRLTTPASRPSTPFRRIAFDDIPGAIDLLLAEQQTAPSRLMAV